MTFKEYIRKYSSLRKFAKKVGIDYRVLQRYYCGKSLPSLRSAYKIYVATGRKVKLGDWFNGDIKKVGTGGVGVQSTQRPIQSGSLPELP